MISWSTLNKFPLSTLSYVRRLTRSLLPLQFPTEKRVEFTLDAHPGLTFRGTIIGEDGKGNVFLARVKVKYNDGRRSRPVPFAVARDFALNAKVSINQVAEVSRKDAARRIR